MGESVCCSATSVHNVCLFFTALLYHISYPRTLIINYNMLSNNVPSTFLVEESDFLPVSSQSWLNFNGYLMHSLMVDWVTSLNDLCLDSIKRLVKQMFINKIWKVSQINPNLMWRSFFQNMFTSRCNCYVTFAVANNTFPNNFMYPHPRKFQNSFGNINIKSFYGNGVSIQV